MAPSRLSSPPPPESSPLSQGLTPAQLSTWHKNGYLLLPNALSESEVTTLLSETHTLLSEFSLKDHPMTRFSTGESTSHVGDEYFLTSGNKIRFFFEEDAFSPTTTTGEGGGGGAELTKPKEKAINKIGHYLHHLHPAFRTISLTQQNAHIARDLGFRDPRVLQSMIICKQPEIGGRVPPHQDSCFLYTNPPSAVGFWYALEDCTVENGCLSFAPGSHKRAGIRERFVRSEDGKGTTFVKNDLGEWPRDAEREEGIDGEEEEEEEYELGEVKAGTLVLIHGNLLHKSERNLSSKGRMIYTFHVIEGGEGWEYDGRNWLQPPEEGFTALNDALKG